MNTVHTELSPHDLQWILQRCPEDILAEMKSRPGRLFLAGGYIRACIAHEEAADIDLFAKDQFSAKSAATSMLAMGASRNLDVRKLKLHETDNAYSIPRHVFGIPVQVISRWVFDTPQQCVESFDFTVAKAAIWWSDGKVAVTANDFKDGVTSIVGQGWRSCCDPNFYTDLAAKRLIYTSPIRNEDPGGSILRVLKFYQRGYRIPLSSLGAVMARMVASDDFEDQLKAVDVQQPGLSQEQRCAHAFTSQLREVDPAVDPKHLAHLPDVKL